MGGLVLAIVMAIAVACASAPPSPPPSPTSASALPSPQFPNYPAEANEFRFHWSAAPGIDLANGSAVAVRAYLESVRLAALAGGDPSVVYPGFMDATPEGTGTSSETGSLVQLQYVRPKTRAEYEKNGWKYVPRQVYGYQPTYVLDISPQGDGYRATVCLGIYSVYRTADDDRDKFFSTVADPETGKRRYPDGRDDVQIWRVELTENDPRAEDAPSASASAQVGPQPAPVDDVFGRWFITGANASQWGPIGQLEYFDTPEVRRQCDDAMPDDAAARTAMATGFHSAPPPHGDPIPGWPAQDK